MILLRCLLSTLALAGLLAGADAREILDHQLTNTERQFVPLVEAMPPAKFGFAPTQGAFQGVRTFAQEAKHAAYVTNEISSALLGEKNPSATGSNENGPDNLTGKEAIVKYVKDAFAYAHRALATVTNQNLTMEAADPFEPGKKRARLDLAGSLISHTFDHYGQMVEYARMNGIVPPASR